MWNVTGLRFSTFFSSGTLKPVPLEEWSLVVGTEPQNIQIVGTGPQRVAIHQGAFQGLNLRADVRQDRVDWLVQPTPPHPSAPLRPLSIEGSFDSIASRFRDLVLEWLGMYLASTHRVTRLAFAPTVGAPFETYAESMAFLDRTIDDVRIDPDAVEFRYTVGKRFPAICFDELEINLLHVWTCTQEQIGEFVVTAGNGLPAPRPARTTTTYAATLTLDVNTQPRREVIPQDAQGHLALELFSLANEHLPTAAGDMS